MQIYQIILWLIVGAAVLVAVYNQLGGRALFGHKEIPDKIIGRKVQLKEFDCGPDKIWEKTIPKATVVSFEGYAYKIEFDSPLEINGKKRTCAYITARFKGYPISNVKQRDLCGVNGTFGLGENGAFSSEEGFICNINLI